MEFLRQNFAVDVVARQWFVWAWVRGFELSIFKLAIWFNFMTGAEFPIVSLAPNRFQIKGSYFLFKLFSLSLFFREAEIFRHIFQLLETMPMHLFSFPLVLFELLSALDHLLAEPIALFNYADFRIDWMQFAGLYAGVVVLIVNRGAKSWFILQLELRLRVLQEYFLGRFVSRLCLVHIYTLLVSNQWLCSIRRTFLSQVERRVVNSHSLNSFPYLNQLTLVPSLVLGQRPEHLLRSIQKGICNIYDVHRAALSWSVHKLGWSLSLVQVLGGVALILIWLWNCFLDDLAWTQWLLVDPLIAFKWVRLELTLSRRSHPINQSLVWNLWWTILCWQSLHALFLLVVRSHPLLHLLGQVLTDGLQ